MKKQIDSSYTIWYNAYTKSKKREELIDVCKAMEEIREEERIKGESQGRQEGEQIGMVTAYIDMGVSVEEIAGKLHITVGEVNKIIAQIEVW